MNGIPDAHGVSGTFAALERTTPIVQIADGVPTTTSMRIANGTGHEHRAVLKRIRENGADFEEFGRVALEVQPFDTAGGVQHREVAILNEAHATLLMTFMRNIGVVKDFKKRLVREFYEMRRAAAPMLTGPQLVAAALVEANRMLGAKDQQIAEMTPKAEFFDELMDAHGTYTMAQAARMVGWGRNVMMRECRRMGILQGNNLPYRRYDHHFKVIPGTRVHPKTGETIPTATTHILPSGVEFLRKKLAGNDALAVSS